MSPTCYECKHLIDTFGNYLECGLSAKEGNHMFVDWYYWNDGCPDKCPLKSNEELTTKEKEFLLDILYKNVDWTCAQIRDGIIKKLHLTSRET